MDCKDEARKEIAENIAHGMARGIAIGIALRDRVRALHPARRPGGAGGCGIGCCPISSACAEITFWQALGLLALCRILFGSFGRGGRPHRDTGRRHREWWKKRPRPAGLAASQNTVSEGGQS